MAFNTNIVTMAQGIDGLGVYENSLKFADTWLARKKDAELAKIERDTQDIEDSSTRFEKMIGLAKQSKRSKWLIDDINAMQSAQVQAQLANQAKMADINKTMSETNKNNATATDTMQGVGGKRLGMLRPAHEILAQTGQTAQAIKYLDYAKASGAIDDDIYQSVKDEWGAWSDLSPDEVKALGFAYAKGTLSPEYNWQTANNMADNETKLQMNAVDNETSRLNNQNTVNAQMYGHDLSYQRGMAELDQKDVQFQQQHSLAQDKFEFERNQVNALYEYQQNAIRNGQARVIHLDGKQYLDFGNGKGQLLVDKDGKALMDKEMAGLKQQKEEDKIRMEKLDMTIQQVGDLIKQSTNGSIDAGFDWLGRQMGYTTDNAEAIAQLRVLAGQLTALMPKMSGPQSDKDVELYKQMAADIANPTKTIRERQSALEMMKSLNQKYAEHAKVTLPSQNQNHSTVTNPFQTQQRSSNFKQIEDSSGLSFGD